MNAKQAALWDRISKFQLDDPDAEFQFSARLARENGWSRAFALNVVEEYRRFVFLAMVAGHPVTPSDEVDQAWHLHLTCTRSYWDEFCGEVLGSPLHHDPTRGGGREKAKYHDWYAKTLASYREYFGEEPPPDIWPPHVIRFGEAAYFRRVNAARHWIIPRLQFPRNAFATGLPAIVALLSAGCGFATLSVIFPFNLAGSEFLGFFFPAALTGIVLAFVIRAVLRWEESDTEGKRLDDPYAVATLVGGGDRAIAAALVSLVQKNSVESGSVKRCGNVPKEAHPLERAIFEKVPENGSVDIPGLKNAVAGPIGILEEHLRENGWYLSKSKINRANLIAFGVAAIMPVIGIARVIQGMAKEKPVGFILAGTLVFGVAALLVLALRHPRGAKGNRLLADLREKHSAYGISGNLKSEPVLSPMIPMAVGLFGVSVLAGTADERLRDLATQIQPISDPGGYSSGCGADSGGGDSGCGGGGCGGCGGD